MVHNMHSIHMHKHAEYERTYVCMYAHRIWYKLRKYNNIRKHKLVYAYILCMYIHNVLMQYICTYVHTTGIEMFL